MVVIVKRSLSNGMYPAPVMKDDESRSFDLKVALIDFRTCINDHNSTHCHSWAYERCLPSVHDIHCSSPLGLHQQRDPKSAHEDNTWEAVELASQTAPEEPHLAPLPVRERPASPSQQSKHEAEIGFNSELQATNRERPTAIAATTQSLVSSDISEYDSQSNLSSDCYDMSPEATAQLSLLYDKHIILVNLMREVYAMFDHRWGADLKICGLSSSQSSSQRSTSHRSSLTNDSLHTRGIRKDENGKRDREDEGRDSPSDGDGDGHKKARPMSMTTASGKGLLFACPFNKFDPRKYRANARTGQLYDKCWRPGFESIARLK